MVVSERLLGELENVLMRERFRRHATIEEVEELLAGLREKGTFFDEGEPERLVPDDPKDDYLMALALTSEADHLVSGDPHLTGLGGEPNSLSSLPDSSSVCWRAVAGSRATG